MNTYKPYTIDELVTLIYEDNLEHFDGHWESSNDCDCHLHTTLTTIVKYWEGEDGRIVRANSDGELFLGDR
jgi:hypothetical protein